MTEKIGSIREFLDRPGGRAQLVKELSEDGDLARDLLFFALKVRGYNNHSNDRVSGEASFRNLLVERIGVEVYADIGCNEGHYARALLEANAALKVFAFDPSKEIVPSMQALVSAYPDRVRFFEKGVGARSERRSFYYSEGESELGSFVRDLDKISYISNDSAIEAETVTLDEVLLDELKLDRLDFIKIDTEGFEAEVLAGAERTLSELRPKAIQFEFNWHQLFSGTTVYKLSQLVPGYQLFQLLPQHIVKRDPTHPYSNFFLYSNFAFLRDDIVGQLK